MFDQSVAFTAEEINLIEAANLELGAFRAWYALFPDQNLDTAIGGFVMYLQQPVAESAVSAEEVGEATSTPAQE